MADTSIFSRLRRLFSNDVIIRNVGGKNLKIMDTGRIQKYGNLATNSLYDRFTRLHKPAGSSLQYNPTLNYQSMRLQLYSDYEAMDHDPIQMKMLEKYYIIYFMMYLTLNLIYLHGLEICVSMVIFILKWRYLKSLEFIM